MKNTATLFLGAAALSMTLTSSANADYWTTVRTPRGTPLPAFAMTYELTPAQIAATDSNARSAYPQATLMRSSSRRYNCHSYAWYSQSTANSIWINQPAQFTYWTDGSYHIPPVIIPNGAKVSYCANDHSAIKYSGSNTDYRDNFYLSKWGSWPLMLHRWSYSPYGTACLHYYVP